MVSIHQPNSRILELFDNILILSDGGMNFFGTVAESIEHLSSLGFPPLNDYTPTDHFLQITDRKFSGHIAIDFAGYKERFNYYDTCKSNFAPPVKREIYLS
jgi:ABC-type multidrug transport system ATPase subunit